MLLLLGPVEPRRPEARGGVAGLLGEGAGDGGV